MKELNISFTKLGEEECETCLPPTLKYFEPGHTFMSVDSFHHGVEKAMKKWPGGNMVDFQDFTEVIASSNSGKVNVEELQSTHILAWNSGHKTEKCAKSICNDNYLAKEGLQVHVLQADTQWWGRVCTMQLPHEEGKKSKTCMSHKDL